MTKLKALALCAGLAAASAAPCAPAALPFNEVESAIFTSFIASDILDFLNKGQNTYFSDVLKKDGKEIVVVDPLQMSFDYAVAKNSADHKYKGKTLYIRNCQVIDNTSDLVDVPIISCLSPSNYMPAQLFMKKSKESFEYAAQIRNGYRIDMVCEGAGEKGGFPLAKDCRPNTAFYDYATKRMKEEFSESLENRLTIAVVAVRLEMVMSDAEKEQCKTNCSQLLRKYQGKVQNIEDWYFEARPRLVELGLEPYLQKADKKIEAMHNKQKQQ